MSDLISRQAAIDALTHEWDGMVTSVFDVVKSLPSAQPSLDEWCTDCKEYDHEKHSCPRWNRVIRTTLKDAQSERTGWWVKMSDKDGIYWACSECGEDIPRIAHFNPQFDLFPRMESIDKTKYCPNCGAKMEVEHT